MRCRRGKRASDDEARHGTNIHNGTFALLQHGAAKARSANAVNIHPRGAPMVSLVSSAFIASCHTGIVLEYPRGHSLIISAYGVNSRFCHQPTPRIIFNLRSRPRCMIARHSQRQ
jgi:hypothetical protein